MRVVYQDDDVCVVHKPAGLLVHRRRSGHDQHVQPLLQRVRDHLRQHVYPVHRLDRATSGLVVFARSPEAAEQISRQFRERTVAKHYQALVRGFMVADRVVDRPLRRRREGSAESAAVMSATTEFHPRQWFELPERSDRYPTTRCTRIDARPRSGRWHQIRRHLNHVAHPVIGDTAHGDNRQNQFFRRRCGASRLMLAAVRLQLCHPRTGQTLDVCCDPDETFTEVIESLQQWSCLPVAVQQPDSAR